MFFRHFSLLSLSLSFSVWAVLYPTPAIAGIIQIETTTTITVAGDHLRAAVKAINKGDVPAHNVQIHLLFLGQKQSGPIKARLGRDESQRVLFDRILAESKKGSYPLATFVNFQDNNKYPFSAVSCSTFYIKENAKPELDCTGKDISFEKNWLLRFKVINTGSGMRAVRATLILPEELSTPVPQRDFQIGPGAEQMLGFEINNFSALSGANYPVFCYLEYDSKDTHFTKIGEAHIRIVKTENWFRRTKLFWLGAAIVLGVILVACQFKRKGP